MATDSNPNKRKKRAPSIKKPYLTEEECDSIKHVLQGAGAGAIRAARRVGGRRAAGPRQASKPLKVFANSEYVMKNFKLEVGASIWAGASCHAPGRLPVAAFHSNARRRRRHLPTLHPDVRPLPMPLPPLCSPPLTARRCCAAWRRAVG